MIWFTSDWHLSHRNILLYSSRPFKDVYEMNEEIFRRFNAKVAETDVAYFLGDFAFGLNGNLDKIYEYRDRINCRYLYMCLGNHDHLIEKYREQLVRDKVFISITDVYTVKETKPNVFLSHYCHKVWNKSHHGVYHAFAHSHGSLPIDETSLSMDVGVDTNNYYPYSFDDIVEHMKKKDWKQLDHHSPRTRE